MYVFLAEIGKSFTDVDPTCYKREKGEVAQS